MRREPRIVRRSMAYRMTHEPPDDAWRDTKVIAVAMVLLGVCCILGSLVPVVPK